MLESIDSFGTVPSSPMEFPVLTPEVRAALLLANNARRYETPDARAKRSAARRERIAAARSEGKSIRTIADAENVSVATVQRDLENSGVSPDTPIADAEVAPSKVSEAARVLREWQLSLPLSDTKSAPTKTICPQCGHEW